MNGMKVVVALWLGMMISGACGGGDAVGTSSGVSRSKTVASLDESEMGVLCDWTNGKQGGYGRNVSCADGPGTTDRDKATCVSGKSLYAEYCYTLTVGEVEDCANAIGTDLCAFYTAAACANVRACLG